MNQPKHLNTRQGLPPDGLEGIYIGFEADWRPHLLSWHKGQQCWATVTFTEERMWEANLLREENEGRVVCWAELPGSAGLTTPWG